MTYQEQFELGISEFNDGRFFECHDTFEELWMESRGEPRRFLQGLIQAAVGLFHAARGNLKGSESQLSKGIEKLSEYQPRYHGVDTAALVQSLDAVRRHVRETASVGAGTVDSALIPRIDYRYEPTEMPS